VDSDKTNTPLRNEYSLETGAILSLEMTEWDFGVEERRIDGKASLRFVTPDFFIQLQ
jgi:hypothetical protein